MEGQSFDPFAEGRHSEVCDQTLGQAVDEAGTNLLKAVGFLAVGGLFLLDDTIGSFEGPWPLPSARAPKPSAAPTVNPTPGGLAQLPTLQVPRR